MLTDSPASPTRSRQDIAIPASTLTRALTPVGSTRCRYATSWASNHSRQGIETTRVAPPGPPRRRGGGGGAAPRERGRYEAPGGGAVPPGGGLPPPLATPSADPYSVRSTTGRFCRVRHSAVGRSVCSRASRHAHAV